MKRILTIFLALLLTVSMLAGCGASQTDAPSAGDSSGNTDTSSTDAGDSAKEDFLVGVAFGAFDATPQLLYAALEEQFKELGWNYTMTNADQDPSKLLSDVENLCQLQCDVIYVRGITDDTMPPIIEACERAGIPLICIAVGCEEMSDRYITLCSDPSDAGADLLGYWFQEYVKANPGEYNVGYVVGDYSYESALCRWTNVRDLNPDTVELVHGEGNWVASDAMTLVEDWLQTYPEMNVICSSSDEMSIGIIQALQAAGKNPDDYLLMSFDGLDIMDDYVKEGWCDATVAIDNSMTAKRIIEITKMVYEGDHSSLDALESVTPTYSNYMLTTDNIQGIKNGTVEKDYYIY